MIKSQQSCLRPRRFRRGLPIVASGILAIHSAHAALVGYENFDSYPSGASLDSQTGGALWPNGSSWSAASGAAVSDEAITYSLDGGNLGSGRTLKLTGNSNNALARANPVTNGKDVFVSFIFQIKGGATDSPVSGTIFTGWQADDPGPSISVDSIGYLGASGKAGARVQNISSAFSDPLLYGRTCLFVIKYTGWNGSAYETTQVWLNPSRSDEATTDPAITRSQTVAGGGSSAFSGIRVRTYGLSATNYQLVDELRIGTTWDDVVSPAPGAPAQFVHPGITLDRTDQDRLRERALSGRPPQGSSWTNFVTSSPGQLGYLPRSRRSSIAAAGRTTASTTIPGHSSISP